MVYLRVYGTKFFELINFYNNSNVSEFLFTKIPFPFNNANQKSAKEIRVFIIDFRTKICDTSGHIILKASFIYTGLFDSAKNCPPLGKDLDFVFKN
jgi:hypothetical protein